MDEQGPKPWTRETNWRQGHLFSPEAIAYFGLSHATEPAATCVVVISHDCDLANDNLNAEPDVEIIVGRIVATASGNFTWGKAPRTLHYTLNCDGAPVHVELVSTCKRVLPKSELARFEPDSALRCDAKTLAIIRSWLSSRYNRAAFPDEFVNRMKDTKADAKLADALKNYGNHISFVYFDLDDGQCIEHAQDDPYKLRIFLVFNPGNDAEAAADAADKAAEKVEEVVSARLSARTAIVLEACMPISEDDITVSQARTLTQWRLEYMTLKVDYERLGPPPA